MQETALGSPIAPLAQLNSGKRVLDRYVIERTIARGGSSMVYAALDERLKRRVCLKVFSTEAPHSPGERSLYDHFVLEATLLGRLQHPNVVQIFDCGFLGPGSARPFEVLELMPGGTLRHLIDRCGPLSPRDMRSLLRPLGHALAAVHLHGVVHRDLKPANVLIYDGGLRCAKLADFGIAQVQGALLNEDLRHSLTLFSPCWSAPEQILGRPVDHTADIFAFGLLIGYALTGKRPFETEADHERACHEGSCRAYVTKRLEPELPPAVMALVARACADDPGDRYASMEKLLDALEVGMMLKPPPAPVSSTEITLPHHEVSPARLVTARVPTELRIGAHIVHATVLRLDADRLQLHLLGRTCFLSRPGGRLTRALDITTDETISLVAPDRKHETLLACRMLSSTLAKALVDGYQATGPSILLRSEGAEPVLLSVSGRS